MNEKEQREVAWIISDKIQEVFRAIGTPGDVRSSGHPEHQLFLALFALKCWVAPQNITQMQLTLWEGQVAGLCTQFFDNTEVMSKAEQSNVGGCQVERPGPDHPRFRMIICELADELLRLIQCIDPDFVMHYKDHPHSSRIRNRSAYLIAALQGLRNWTRTKERTINERPMQ